MSKYTTELRYICENYAGLDESVGGNGYNEVIENSRASLFDFNYPIFDEEYREGLEKKIIKHYYMREIGFETVGLFKIRLDMKMNEIMPYYNQLYESARLEFNPFYDVDYTRTHVGSTGEEKNHSGNSEYSRNGSSTRNEEGSNTGVVQNQFQNSENVENENVGKNLYSDTPQGSIVNLENNSYLTNATIDVGSDTSETTGSGSSTQNTTNGHTVDVTNSNTESGNNSDEFTETVNGDNQYTESVTGKMGTVDKATLLKKYRETFLNIDMQVINELEDLFFQLW